MALLFAEGFNDVPAGSGALAGKPHMQGNTGWTIVASDGWGGANSFSHDVDDQSFVVDLSGATSDDTIIFQFALKLDASTLNQQEDNDWLVRFANSSSTAAPHVGLMCNTNGGILVFAGGTPTTPIGYIANWRKNGLYHYIQIKHVLHASTGSIEIWIDGVQKFSASGIDTQSGAETSVDRILVSVPEEVATNGCSVDDIIVMDSTAGGGMDDLIDPVYIEQLIANADGNVNNWAQGGTGTNNIDFVDDPFSSVYDSDTTYLSSSTVDQDDFVNVANLAPDYTVGTVHFSMARPVLRDDGSGQVRIVTERAGSEVATADIPLTTSYIQYNQIAYVDPNGGGAWSETNINDVEVGVRFRT